MYAWTIDNFTPSDGRKVHYVTVDHQAWLKGTASDKETIHMCLNMSSRGVSEQQFKAMLETMCKALSEKPC